MYVNSKKFHNRNFLNFLFILCRNEITGQATDVQELHATLLRKQQNGQKVRNCKLIRPGVSDHGAVDFTQGGPQGRRQENEYSDLTLFSSSNIPLVFPIGQNQLEARGQENPQLYSKMSALQADICVDLEGSTEDIQPTWIFIYLLLGLPRHQNVRSRTGKTLYVLHSIIAPGSREQIINQYSQDG